MFADITNSVVKASPQIDGSSIVSGGYAKRDLIVPQAIIEASGQQSLFEAFEKTVVKFRTLEDKRKAFVLACERLGSENWTLAQELPFAILGICLGFTRNFLKDMCDLQRCTVFCSGTINEAFRRVESRTGGGV